MSGAQITSSVATIEGPPDADGSFFVRETHTWSDGTVVYYDNPHTPIGLDYTARMTARAAEINVNIAALSVGA